MMRIEKQYILFRRDNIEVRKFVSVIQTEGRPDIPTGRTISVIFLGDELFSADIRDEKRHRCYYLSPINDLIAVLDAYMGGRFTKKSTPLVFQLCGATYYSAGVKTRGTDNLHLCNLGSSEEAYLSPWDAQSLRNCLGHVLSFVMS
jgi:hypothetical protein